MAGGGHRSIHEANLTVPLAEMCRDVLCKEVYEAAFAWLVDHINRQAPSEEEQKVAAVEGEASSSTVVKTLFAVDAFGFENLAAADNKVRRNVAELYERRAVGRFMGMTMRRLLWVKHSRYQALTLDRS
jgi:hypothetical protein